MKTMYPAQANSPGTELSEAIDAVQTTIPLADASRVPDAPNILTIGTDEAAETILYTAKTGNELTGVVRGFQGTGSSWTTGTKVARYMTAYDHDMAKQNIEGLYDRLDTSDTDTLTLEPGLQVINAERDARFRLGEIQGKTEINGQGRIGIVGVENPYVMQTSGNLLPPFYEWGTPFGNITDPYTVKPSANVSASSGFISIKPSGEYIFTVTVTGTELIGMSFHSSDGTELYTTGYLVGSEIIATAPTGAVFAQIHLASPNVVGTYMFKNPTLGTTVKPFVPQEKSMLAFQTELHANPDTGINPDILFEQNGEYKKLAKWKKVVLDGSLGWTLSVYSTLTYKQVRFSSSDFRVYSGYVTKYNGTLCTNNGTLSVPTNGDQFNTWSDGVFYITVYHSDSGWGPDYNPTVEEIKAYFNGWRMFEYMQSLNTPYNGTGRKGWCSVKETNNVTGLHVADNVPTTPNTTYEYTPYNLLYRLAKEVVEPVVSEGCLTLSEGDNVVEVGTGIVLRERANPKFNSASAYVINQPQHATSLTYQTNKIVDIYKNNSKNYEWFLRSNVASGYGGADAFIAISDYDQSASYSVTYIKLDKSPVVPIVGTVAANEKAQISDLTAGVAEVLTRVSVVEQKKAEKDAPAWIMPTLLNGAVHGASPVYYKKFSNGLVLFKGIFVATTSSAIMRLPVGYRPKNTLYINILALTDGTLVHSNLTIHTNGYIEVGYVGTNYMSLDGIIFEAEQ